MNGFWTILGAVAGVTIFLFGMGFGIQMERDGIGKFVKDDEEV